MKRSVITLAVLLLGAMVGGACGPATIVANPAPPQRQLVVTGAATVTMDPDVAYINIGVHTELPDAAEAVSTNNAETQKVIAALRKSGVEEKDIRTMNFNLYPNDRYDPQTNEKLETTYVVDNTVRVTVHEVSKLGEVLGASLSAGANRVNNVQFDVADRTQALGDARDAALKDAQAQAEGLAAAGGLKLGKVQRVDFYNTAPSRVTTAGKGGGGGEGTVPIQGGQLTLTVTVTVTYELE